MLDDLWFVAKDYVIWLKRRTFLLVYALVACLFLPLTVGKGVVDKFRGKGWFADPRGKSTLTQYGMDMAEFALAALFLRTKQATEEAFAAAKSAPARTKGEGVSVQLMDDYLEFQPKGLPGDARNDQPLVGVIIVPGAFVSPFAYSILARSLAQKGYPSFVLRLPFDLAFYGWETAGQIIKRRRGEGQPVPPTKWVLAGHSLGAIGVELFTAARPDCVDGMVYIGSRNKIRDTVASLELPTLVITGSRDPFTSEQMIIQRKTIKILSNTERVVVEGGNHRGFASYSHQPLDWEATITPEEQQGIVVEAIADFIERKVAIP